MLEFRLALRLLRMQHVVTVRTLFALTIGIGMATALGGSPAQALRAE